MNRDSVGTKSNGGSEMVRRPTSFGGGLPHGSVSNDNILAIPEPIHAITATPTQDPTAAGAPGISIPPAIVQMLLKTSPALGPKPSAPPPHPQITATTAAIPGGLQCSFTQLVSPTPYSNQIVSYRIYRNTSGSTFSGAQLIKTVPHDNSVNQKTVQVQDLLGTNKTASYFVTAVDSTGQESTQPGAFQTSGVTSQTFNPNVLQAIGSTNLPSTTSATYAVIPEMSVTITAKGNPVLIAFTATVFFQSFSGMVAGSIAIFKDSVQLSQDYIVVFNPGTAVNSNIEIEWPFAVTFIDSPTAGSHTYTMQWKRNTGSVAFVADGVARRMQVLELG